MMEDRIRAAQARDLPQIGKIWNDVIAGSTATFTTTPKTEASLAQWFEERARGAWPVLVLMQDGAVVGFATCGPFRSGEGYSHVAEHSIYLAECARGRGQGLALYQALERAALARSIDVFVAAISGDNLRAQRFHARLGFAETARMPDMGRKMGRQLELVLMQKHLECD